MPSLPSFDPATTSRSSGNRMSSSELAWNVQTDLMNRCRSASARRWFCCVSLLLSAAVIAVDSVSSNFASSANDRIADRIAS